VIPRTLALAAVLALTACGNSDPATMDDPAEPLRDAFARILADADSVLYGDIVNYLGNRAAERIPTRCRADTCSLGFIRYSDPTRFSVENVDLTLVGTRPGIQIVREDGSFEWTDVEVYGGWMRHAFFATQADLFTNPADPNRGYTRVKAYAVGQSPGVNPILTGGSAQWSGLMLGRDLAVGSDRGRALRGDATIRVEFGAAGMAADVLFSGIAVIGSGAARPDMAWRGMPVAAGAFEHYESPSERIRGRFYGPDQQETGGIFERGTITGAFGGVRR
jgi:hypothetical protein